MIFDDIDMLNNIILLFSIVYLPYMRDLFIIYII